MGVAEKSATLEERYERAAPQVRELVDRLLEHDVAADAWREQIGPALTQRDTGKLLGKSPQAVAKDAGLVRVPTRDGRVMYPVCQFDGRRRVDGVSQVVRALAGVVEGATIASWLTAPNDRLDGRAPIGALRDGDQREVVELAEQLAEDLT